MAWLGQLEVYIRYHLSILLASWSEPFSNFQSFIHTWYSSSWLPCGWMWTQDAPDGLTPCVGVKQPQSIMEAPPVPVPPKQANGDGSAGFLKKQPESTSPHPRRLDGLDASSFSSFFFSFRSLRQIQCLSNPGNISTTVHLSIQPISSLMSIRLVCGGQKNPTS